MPKPSTLATRLAQARVVSGLLQRDLAKLSGLSLNVLKHFESGSHKLEPAYAVTVSSAIGVSAAWLLGFGKEKEPVNLRGEPFTREWADFFRQYLSLQFQYAPSVRPLRQVKTNLTQENLAELEKMYADLHAARTKAWSDYISSLVKDVLDPSNSLNLIELLGCHLSSILLREYLGNKESTAKYSSVDEVARRQLKKGRAKRPGPAPGSPGQS
jgi:transcriptional regulator with XRE-family HTH domain